MAKSVQKAYTVRGGGTMPIRVLIHPDEEGGYWAEANFQNGGVTAQGDTLDEVKEEMLGAVACFLEMDESEELDPAVLAFEVVYA